MLKTKDRQKVNFMIRRQTIIQLNKLIPKGKKSDFVNGALEEALIQHARRTASEEIDKLREMADLKVSTREFIKCKNYGRL